MTIENEVRRSAYVGDGVTTTFPVPFQFFELRVYVDGVDATQGVDFVISQTTAGASGSVVLAVPPAPGASVVIVGDTAPRQDIDYVDTGPFPAESHERGLDRLTMLAQELRLKLDQTVRFPPHSGPVPDFDFEGNPDAVLATDGDGTLDLVPRGSLLTDAYQTLVEASDSLDASLTDFRSRFVGAFNTDPTTDGNGDALQTGAIYWNLPSKTFRVYDATTSTFSTASVSTTVFGRSGNVIAVAGDYDDTQVRAPSVAAGYVPAAETVRGHLVGVGAAIDGNAANIAALETSVADLEAREAGANVLTATWADLALIAKTSDFNGQGAEVIGPDGGTHTDPVTAATVPNEGRYSWVHPTGWKRIGGTGISALTIDTSELAQLLPDNVYRNVYPLPISAAVDKTYNNATGLPVTVAGAAAMGLVPCEPGQLYHVDLSCTSAAWTIYDTSNAFYYDASGTFIARTTTGFTIGPENRSAKIVVPADGVLASPVRFFAFAVKYTIAGSFAVGNVIPPGAYDILRNQLMISQSATAPVRSDYSVTAPPRRPDKLFDDEYFSKEPVTLVKHGQMYFVRTRYGSQDQVRRIYIGKSSTAGVPAGDPDRNGGIDFASVRRIAINQDPRLIPGLFAASTDHDAITSDDMPPVYMNTMYLGGNHGFVGRKLTTTHGKTNADIGSIWQASSGAQYVLFAIKKSNEIIFVARNTAGSDQIWSINTGPIGGAQLTHVSGATNTAAVTIADDTQWQVRPAVTAMVTDVYADDVAVDRDGVWPCSNVRMVARYEVKNLAEVLNYLIANVGTTTAPDYADASIPTQIAFSLSYVINPEGMMSWTYGLEAEQAANLLRVHGAQAQAIYTAGSETRHQYVGGMQASHLDAVGANARDFQNGSDVTANPTNVYNFDSSAWLDADHPPSLMWQVVKDGGGVPKRGMVLGFSTLSGDTRDVVRRPRVTASAALLSTFAKMYPQIAYNFTASAGDLIVARGFYGFFNPTIDPSSLLWATYMEGKKDALVWVTNQVLDHVWVPVPKRLVGQQITRIDDDGMTAAVTIHSDIVTDRGILVSSTGYGGFRVTFD